MIKFGDNYEVDRCGTIWACEKQYTVPERTQLSKGGTMMTVKAQTRTRKRIMLKPCDDNYGYLQIRYYDNGERVCDKIHRIVAKAYLENPESKRTVNHKDGDKYNNHYTNLEWATDGENESHAYETGLKECQSFEVGGKIYSRAGLLFIDYPTMDRSGFYKRLRESDSFKYKGVIVKKYVAPEEL